MKGYISIFLLLFSFNGISQNRNSVWCFGDSAGMDFSTGAPTLFTSSVKSRGSSASISDTLGNLLFYSFTRATLPGNTTVVYNSDHVLMQNGNNIIGRGWYQELVIVPSPSDTNLYFLFCIGETGGALGLYYSIIDLSQDSGRGAVTIKNFQLQSYKASDDLVAIRHGNGRDWWIISRRWDTSNDEFYEYLITPLGLSGPFIMHEGDYNGDGFKWISVSKSGKKFVCFDPTGMIQVFDFDRCSGNITLSVTVSHNAGGAPYPNYFGAEFSPNEQLLYVAKFTDSVPDYPTYLMQYDLNATNILSSADTLWNYTSTPVAVGKLKLAPDGKIYFANIWYDGVNFPFPYPDSVYNTVNNNLSVLNYPDSPGVACGFAPFSFNLGAGRTYWGLPNNPDYEMGPDTNSMCDTITGVRSQEFGVRSEELHVFYHSGWQKLFVNAENLKGKDCLLQIFDINGREVFSSAKRTQPPYFTQDVDVGNLSNGMYVVSLLTEKERLVEKFIKE